MNENTRLLSVFSAAVLFVFLFHRQAVGLNLMFFEITLLSWLAATGQFRLTGKYAYTAGIGVIITSAAVVTTYSTFSLVANFLTLFVFVGLIIYPEAKSLLNSFWLSFFNLVPSQFSFLRTILKIRFKKQSLGNYVYQWRIFLIPAFIVTVFILIYQASNPVFDDMVSRAGIFLNDIFIDLFRNFDTLIIFTFTLGLIISNFILFRKREERIIKSDANSDEQLYRGKNKKRKAGLGLKREHKAAIFLLTILNLLLLVINVIDVNWVWFNFSWNGQYLKQFVHEGTYLLILSIFISIGLVLYFFRNNLNFFSRNKLLKYLCYAWLVQNAVLTVSVAIRNFRYIDFFSLAYKRIWVLIFLALVLYGLYTVLVKVKYRKSAFYLFKSNTYAIIVVLIFFSVFDWDNIIAKYNFKHSDRAFLHLDYLATLSDQALPYLDKPLDELVKTDKIQKEKFRFEEKYMSPQEYHTIIERRKESFKEKWEAKRFLSWNLPEYLAYKKLFSATK